MNWIRERSIRVRITVWSVVIGAVLISVSSIGFRLGVGAIINSSTRTLLATDAAPYEQEIQQGSTSSFELQGERQLVAVVDPQGIVRISNLPDSLADRGARLYNIGSSPTVVAGSNGAEYDVTSEKVTTPKGTWTILAARNRAQTNIALGTLTAFLAVGALAVILAFGLSVWVVTGFALRPVNRMREQARRLSIVGSADTLPVGPARDELSALAMTLNDFITTVRESNDRERQMVADASHEMRTPLAVLKTQLQLAHLSRGDADALEREIGAAEQTLERLSALTTNLLTLSRIEAADVQSTASGDEILAEFLSCMDRAIVLGSTRSVSVDFSTKDVAHAAGIPISAADFAGLVDNLVGNAIAASPRGALVDVELAAEEGMLGLAVTDSGHGIPDNFLPLAFDRFSRSDISRTQTAAGSGLGLAIVKAIVSRSGGSVSLHPRPEGGVVARAVIPLGPPVGKVATAAGARSL